MPNTQGMLARLFVKPILPRRCSPPGWDGATSWGASGVSLQPLFQSHLPVTLPRNASFNVEEVMRGSPPDPPSLLRAWVSACPSKGQSRQPTQGQEMSKRLPGPFPPLPFLGPQGQVLLPCPVFSHCRLSGVCSGPQSWPLSRKKTQACLRTSRCSSPQDAGASQVSPAHRTRATHKRAFLERD